jgi:hypothetical protein
LEALTMLISEIRGLRAEVRWLQGSTSLDDLWVLIDERLPKP